MIEPLRVYAWLNATLTGDATLMASVTGVFAGAAPEGQTAPFVVYNWQGGQDVMVQGGRRVMNDSLYQVKVVAPSDQIVALQTAADRIDTLLQRASGSANGGVILFCLRERATALDNTVNGVLWSNIGGLYRMLAQ